MNFGLNMSASSYIVVFYPIASAQLSVDDNLCFHHHGSGAWNCVVPYLGCDANPDTQDPDPIVPKVRSH